MRLMPNGIFQNNGLWEFSSSQKKRRKHFRQAYSTRERNSRIEKENNNCRGSTKSKVP